MITPPALEDNLATIRRVVKRYSLRSLLCIGVFILLAVAANSFLPSVYESTGKFMLPIELQNEGFGMSLQGYKELATGDDVLDKVAGQLSGNLTPELLRKALSVELDPNSAILLVSSKSRDAKQAKDILDKWYSSYKEQVYEQSSGQIETRIKIFNNVIGSMEKELDNVTRTLLTPAESKNSAFGLILAQGGSYSAKYVESIAERSKLQTVADNLREMAAVNRINKPLLPESPVFPRKNLNIAVAGILGVIIAITFVSIRVYLEI